MITPINPEDFARLMQEGMQEHFRQKRVAQVRKARQIGSAFAIGMALAWICDYAGVWL